MCGRYAASAAQADLVETFEVDLVADLPQPPPWQAPRYNIAPTDQVSSVLERVDKTSGEVVRRLTGLRWGLVPSWTKPAAGGGPASSRPLVNARFETVAAKPSFAKAFASRRCLLPADGYYEWYPLLHADGSPVVGERNRPVKQPFYIRPVSGPMVMAGLYEFWRDPTLDSDDPSAWLVSTCIITTSASDDLGHIHDRMPVQVAHENWDAWLDPNLTDSEAARALAHVPEPGEMVAHAVSRLVNTVTNDGPELIEPLPEER
ncbi:SOS response-associated peptidase [Aestuariimicrobium ganziense]|uniref:SOS response-associated peptidase n=1 Tax=Aestuariimicrobium ganziense TaxID=2773677 RepID=UPI0019439906|nr:SOS response-associated peptidase [Aestuariimicrobium ganziense]